MAPAHQGLGPDHAPGGDLAHRLVVDHQLTARDGGGQGLLDARRKGVRLLAVPSTCAQFKPYSETFALDPTAPPRKRPPCVSGGVDQAPLTVSVPLSTSAACTATATSFPSRLP